MSRRALGFAAAALAVSPAIAVGVAHGGHGLPALAVTTVAVMAAAMWRSRSRAQVAVVAVVAAVAAAASSLWWAGAAEPRPTFDAVLAQLGTGLFPSTGLLLFAIGDAGREGAGRELRVLVIATIAGTAGWVAANAIHAVAPLPTLGLAAAAIGVWLDGALRDEEPRPLAALVAGGAVYLVARDLTHETFELGIVAKRAGLVIAAGVMFGLGARSRRVRAAGLAVAWIAALVVAVHAAVVTVPDTVRARARKPAPPSLDGAITATPPPSFTTRGGADWEGAIELLGLNAPREVARGEAVTIELFFRARKPLPPDRVVSVRLHGCDDMAGSVEQAPVGGAYPTQRWKPGEVVRHTVRIPIAPGATPCEYEVVVGWRHRPSREQMLVTFGSVPQSWRGDALVDHVRIVHR